MQEFQAQEDLRAKLINELYDKALLGYKELADHKVLITEIIEDLDQGAISVANKINNSWQVNQWVKKAILLYFRISSSRIMDSGELKYFDKIGLKFSEFDQKTFMDNLIRAVPGSIVRKGAYVGKNVVLMPSFVNIGASIGDNSMIDTWSTIGSCAQIGKNCHISGGVGIGGVLEPIQANPVIIEDDCFIGARSEIAEGVIVEQGSVISMGVYIGASTRIYDRESGETYFGRVPAYSVVVPGNLPSKNNCSLYSAIIVKKVDAGTREKTSINELLRQI